ncbi:hypothetical protein HK098_004853 [Nowakowskiella sp. JEL0407]|nr:hypothetical protein HK098_004853 [Nowakowskiella sp. JEL0407]
MSIFASRTPRGQWFRIILACLAAVIITNYIDHHFLFQSDKYLCKQTVAGEFVVNDNLKSESKAAATIGKEKEAENEGAWDSGSSNPDASPKALSVDIDPIEQIESLISDPRHQEKVMGWMNKFYQSKVSPVPSYRPPPSPKPVPPVVVAVPKIVYDCSNREWSSDHMVWDRSIGFLPNATECRIKNAMEGISHNIDKYFMADKTSYWNELNNNVTKTAALKKEWMDYMDNLGSFESYQRKGFFKGDLRGVVYTAHAGSFKRCLKSIRFLRALNCSLPIEVFYLTGELTDDHINTMEEESNVRVRDLTDPSNPFPSAQRNEKMKRNFQVKSASILNSNFTEILYLDSDNLPMMDPSFLFEIEAYKLTGAIMWPDFWKTYFHNPIWNVMGVPCRDEWEVEAGQLVIDKKRNWKAMNLAHYMQSHYEIYFKLLNGDKDTFRFGFLALNQTFFMVPHFLGSAGLYLEDRMCGNTMLQMHPIDGSPLFAHMNLVKDLESDGMVEARPREFVFKRYTHPNPWDPNLQPEFYATHVGSKDVPCVDLKTAPQVKASIQQGWFVHWAPSAFFDLYDQIKT